jgi:transposase-like protein
LPASSCSISAKSVGVQHRDRKGRALAWRRPPTQRLALRRLDLDHVSPRLGHQQGRIRPLIVDHVPRRVDDDCLQELRWLYDRRDLIEARRDLAAWLAKWSSKYSKLTGWVEDNIDETLTFYRLPRQHHKHLKSTNMLERLNEEIRRRTHVVRIFPNGDSCLRLVRALAVETHENWLEQHRYLNMDDVREHKKEALRRAA